MSSITSQNQPPSPFTLAVLQTPELLLLIFSFLSATAAHDENHGALASSALVCSAWLGPARSTLYGSLTLVWRYSLGNPLLSTLSSNPSLLSLVTNLEVEGYDERKFKKEAKAMCDELSTFEQEDYDEVFWEEPGVWTDDNLDSMPLEKLIAARLKRMGKRNSDSPWFSHGDVEKDFTLVDFLRHLPNLRKLTLEDFSSPTRPSFGTQLIWIEVDKVLARLTTLEILHCHGWLGERVLRGAHNLHTLHIATYALQYTPPPLPFLRHLTIGARQPLPSAPELGFNIAAFHQSLETLTFDDSYRLHLEDLFKSFPIFSRLTTISLGTWESRNSEALQSLVAASPSLQHLEGHNLKHILSHIPQSLETLVDGKFLSVDENNDEKARGLVVDYLADVGHLTKLRMLDIKLEGGTDECCNDLVEECEKRGLELVIKIIPCFPSLEELFARASRMPVDWEAEVGNDVSGLLTEW